MSKRLSIDDLLPSGSESDESIIKQDGNGKPRILRNGENIRAKRKPEMYLNETELKKAACDFLKNLPACKLLKTDNMALLVGNGRRVKTRNPGMADHHLCIRGLFVAIEAKMPGKNLDPDQINYKRDILSAGGIFIMYHSLHELVTELKKYKLVSKRFEI